MGLTRSVEQSPTCKKSINFNFKFKSLSTERAKTTRPSRQTRQRCCPIQSCRTAWRSHPRPRFRRRGHWGQRATTRSSRQTLHRDWAAGRRTAGHSGLQSKRKQTKKKIKTFAVAVAKNMANSYKSYQTGEINHFPVVIGTPQKVVINERHGLLRCWKGNITGSRRLRFGWARRWSSATESAQREMKLQKKMCRLILFQQNRKKSLEYLH